ncbi:MAG TPA: AraC family transcriptional regulator [Xanthobacteraceae bacterium]|nr:AraC family transcriptional regulator [Xanthobacteraceae bacterium]
MIEPPSSFAEMPDRRLPAATDLLSEMLKAVRLTGAVFLNACFTAPFGVIDPKSYSERTPMARLRHISILHLIVVGECEFETAGECHRVSAGDLIFLPLPGQYKFWSGKPDRIAQANEIIQPGPIEGVWTVNYGGGGEEVRMVCGFVESSEFLFTPVFRTLPTMLIERTTEDKVGALIASTVREIVSRVEAATPGSQAVLGRLMELLFVELLRRHIARLPAGSKGWFAALNDPVVSRALQLLHAEPGHRWTLDEIAKRIGSSRTVLSDRFKALLGRPPIEYLANWRIQLAAERLRVGHESIPSIATSIGYKSEAAFNRAFKRITGQTPGSWRDATTSSA